MRLLHSLLLVALPCSMQAQVLLSGVVRDARTRAPLAFVHVLEEGQREGATTDIDGRFTIRVTHLPTVLRFSYVGYAPLRLTVEEAGNLNVTMEPTAVQLGTAEVRPGDNPAHRIIRRVQAARRSNDGMRYRAHRYQSYGKTVFTAALDSALLNDPEKLAALDSNDREAVDFLERQHLLLIESATKKSFIPPADEKEEVLAMRVSGLKDPSLLALAASSKGFSLYEAQIVLNERSYLGPVAPNSEKHYLFILEDTLYQGRDSVYVISYRPRSGTKFDGLKGILHIHTDGYALESGIAEPVEQTGGTSMKVQQRFERIAAGEARYWFPTQLNTFLYFDFVQVQIWRLMGISRTYLRHIELDVPIARKEVRGPEFVAERLDMRRDEAYWNNLRTDTLDARDMRTYEMIDSLGEAHHFDRKAKVVGALFDGRWPIGPIDLLLERIASYDNYQGLRLGLGAATNDRVSRYSSVGGYFGYGFRDKKWKYGGDLTLKPWRSHGPALTLFYRNDVEEMGGMLFRGVSREFRTDELFRLLYVDRMDRVERIGAEVLMRRGGLKLWLGTQQELRINDIGYRFVESVEPGVTLYSNSFRTGALTLSARYAFREPVARLDDRELDLGTTWPVLHAGVWRAVDGLWGGELDSWRAYVMVEKKHRIRLFGDFTWRILGGLSDASAPYPFLFNLRGTNGGALPLSVNGSFETMRPNEFLADRTTALFLRHDFGNLLFKGRKFRPRPSVVFNAGWGELQQPGNHEGLSFASADQGYFEAGLRIDALLRSGVTAFGVGAFHRIGAYATGNSKDDLAVKLALSFTF
ncbi:MAG: carboxypeptidase-like regulatory domain-containing protein [Flavobacteriales bacterium]|nr:carboxypeptidase-like regulatory domain-containing protein [Flavobacteriales bacterium]